MNLEGLTLPQAFRSKLKDTGMLRLSPKILALIAVHRQIAASRSTRPCRRLQQGLVAGDPTMTFTSPSKSAHTLSLRASLGHLPPDPDGEGVGGEGVDGEGVDGGGVGLGLGLRLLHEHSEVSTWVAETNWPPTRIRQMNRAAIFDEHFMAISIYIALTLV